MPLLRRPVVGGLVVLATVSLLLAVPALATPTGLLVGAYAGAGPSEFLFEDGRCEWRGNATVVLRAPARQEGLWAMDLVGPKLPLEACSGLSLGGFHWWPSYVADNLTGSPDEGFHGVGAAGYAGTSSGRTDWSLDVGSVGEGTPYELTLEFHPDGGSPTYTLVWRGTADLVGAHA